MRNAKGEKLKVKRMRICPECGKASAEINCADCGVPTISQPEKEFEELDLVGTVFLEKYRIEELIGEGGMGSVYRAQQLNINRPVALKTLHSALMGQETFLRRFRREARAASRLSSPHVVRVFDYGIDEKREIPFIVMELLEGDTLFDVLDRDGNFPLPRAAEVLLQVARALVDAEEAGIVHRDLKPENIFLGETPDGGDFAKVMDFGVARVAPKAGDTAESLETSSMVVGTPRYMAPEQIRGGDVGPKADLYALGCLLYFLITGAPPYERDDNFAVMDAHLKAPIPPLPKQDIKGAIVPSSMVDLYFELMAKQPRGRPSGARAALRQLSRIRDDIRAGVEGSSSPSSRASKTQVYGSAVPDTTAEPTPSHDLSGGLAKTAAGPSLVVGDALPEEDILATTSAGPSGVGVESPKEEDEAASQPQAAAPAQLEPAPAVVEAKPAPAPPQRVKSQTIVDFSEDFPTRNKQLVGIALGILAFFVVGFAFLFSSGSGEKPDGEGVGPSENLGNSATLEAPSTPEQPTPAPSKSEAQTPKPQQPETISEPEQEVGVAGRVKVMVESEPTGAEVRRNGILLGKTPMELNPERGQPPFKLNFELAGYSPEEKTVDPQETSSVRALLTPKAKTRPSRAGKVRRTPTSQSETPRSQPPNKIDTMLD